MMWPLNTDCALSLSQSQAAQLIQSRWTSITASHISCLRPSNLITSGNKSNKSICWTYALRWFFYTIHTHMNSFRSDLDFCAFDYVTVLSICFAAVLKDFVFHTQTLVTSNAAHNINEWMSAQWLAHLSTLLPSLWKTLKCRLIRVKRIQDH